ncbi:DnaJ domain-containing protein [Arabiibacter massiliensis]|uniref:DnaJ domain-containing protein n=1 Tax=Arabiibacter massiliensis TaxID=1870985 RepID=UPI0009B9F46D|nr:DnaJ domain-containing protein [Arabiibacter massiliensis]
MDIWDILGIRPTKKKREIKRAYARQVAQHHPEDHPEEFQLVQAAYERALLWADDKAGRVSSVMDAPAAQAAAEAGAGAKPAGGGSDGGARRAGSERRAGGGRDGERPGGRDGVPGRSAPQRPSEPPALIASAGAPRRSLFADGAEEPGEYPEGAALEGGDGFPASDIIRESLREDAREARQAREWLDEVSALLARGESLADFLEPKRRSSALRDERFLLQVGKHLRPFVGTLGKEEVKRLLALFSDYEGEAGAGTYDLLGMLNARREVLYARRTKVTYALVMIGTVLVIAAYGAFSYAAGFGRMGMLRDRVEHAEERREAAREIQEKLDVVEKMNEGQERIDKLQALVDERADENRAEIAARLGESLGGTWEVVDERIVVGPLEKAYVTVREAETGEEQQVMVSFSFADGTVSSVDDTFLALQRSAAAGE